MKESKYRVRFQFNGHYHTRSVSVIGDFNHWSPEALPMQDDDGDNIWNASVELPAGRYEYLFLVDGQNYRTDPKNPNLVQKENASHSMIEVGCAVEAPGRHDPEIQIDRISEKTLLIHAFFHKDICRKARLQLLCHDRPDCISGNTMLIETEGTLFSFRVEQPEIIHSITYYFELTAADGTIRYFGATGLASAEWEVEDFEYTAPKTPVVQTPDWVKNSVFYQIFPERFCNGNPDNDPKGAFSPDELPTSESHYGGDLEGVAMKTPYLQELGINAVYLNPVFKAPSPHKYDTEDYMEIDPHFGGKPAFDRMRQAFEAAGIRFILDGVFNHCGPEFSPFKDLKKKEEKSAYRDWFYVEKFPLLEKGKPNYACWWGFPNHPKLNVDHPETRKYLLSVAEHWLDEGASGWRLDVPSEIAPPFWREFRALLKSKHPETFITGEIWENALEWLKGDTFDSVMNYPFRDACIDFFARRETTALEFCAKIGETLAAYPFNAQLALLNLLSSHDTARFYTLCEGDFERIKLAVAFQMTFIGVPMVYYGEEIGMQGGKDPDNRRFMIWDEDKQDLRMLELYRKLIRIRRENPVLQSGECRIFYAQDRVIGFERTLGRESLAIFINNNAKCTHIDITEYLGNGDFLDISKDHPLKRKKAFTLYEYDFTILKKLKER